MQAISTKRTAAALCTRRPVPFECSGRPAHLVHANSSTSRSIHVPSFHACASSLLGELWILRLSCSTKTKILFRASRDLESSRSSLQRLTCPPILPRSPSFALFLVRWPDSRERRSRPTCPLPAHALFPFCKYSDRSAIDHRTAGLETLAMLPMANTCLWPNVRCHHAFIGVVQPARQPRGSAEEDSSPGRVPGLVSHGALRLCWTKKRAGSAIRGPQISFSPHRPSSPTVVKTWTQQSRMQ